MFEINNLENLTKNNYCYEMKNFYKNPDEICDLLNKERPFIHKWGEKNSLNTFDFLDCRHEFKSNDFEKTERKLYKFLKKKYTPRTTEGLVMTNFMRFFFKKDYHKNNYWHPHTDDVVTYNCLVYLNKKPCDGTNIYVQLKPNKGGEHENPWQSRNNYALLQNIKSEYNKLVIFRANLVHGLAYNEDKFRKEFRKNQVIFI